MTNLSLSLQKELESVKETILRLERKVDESVRSAADRDRNVMEAIRAVQATAQEQHNKAWWHKIFKL